MNAKTREKAKAKAKVRPRVRSKCDGLHGGADGILNIIDVHPEDIDEGYDDFEDENNWVVVNDTGCRCCTTYKNIYIPYESKLKLDINRGVIIEDEYYGIHTMNVRKILKDYNGSVLNFSGLKMSQIPKIPLDCKALILKDCSHIISLYDLPDSIEELVLDNSGICYISNLPKNLKWLSLRSCVGIKELPPFPEGLKYIDLYCTGLSNITNLPDKLSHLNITYTSIATLPLTPYTLQSFCANSIFMPPMHKCVIVWCSDEEQREKLHMKWVELQVGLFKEELYAKVWAPTNINKFWSFD